jgi:Phage capsid family.
MSKFERLREAALSESMSAKSLALLIKEENRGFTPEEQERFDAHLAKGRELIPAMKDAKADEDIIRQAKAIAHGVGGDPSLSQTAGGRTAWAKTAAQSVHGTMTNGATGQKALVSGTLHLTNPIENDILTMAAAPRTILDLLRGQSPSQGDPYGRGDYQVETGEQFTNGLFGNDGGGNTFSFLRQTVRTNNAAPVADNATKPTSVYSFAEVEERYRVIAHLSEAVPQRLFHDHRALAEFLASEMALGIEMEVEDQVVSGDGTGENLTGLLTTSGIQTQAFATDTLTTTRKALTKLQAYGMAPTAWAVNPADAEGFDLLREGAGTGQFLLGGPGGDTSKSLWTIPRVPSLAVPAGTAILADWTQASLQVRQGATLHVDAGGVLFEKNQVRFRVEGRFGLAVKRPAAFVSVDLTA